MQHATRFYTIELPEDWMVAVDQDHLQAGGGDGRDILEIVIHPLAAPEARDSRHWLGVLQQNALDAMLQAARDPQLKPSPRPTPKTLDDGGVLYEMTSYTLDNDFFFYQCCRTGRDAVLHALYQGPCEFDRSLAQIRAALQALQWKTTEKVI